MIKKIFILILLLFGYLLGNSQCCPSGFPITKSSGWIQYGWVQTDSGFIAAKRDTNFSPRFLGTMVYWQHTGVDSSIWVYQNTTGKKWGKMTIGNVGTVTSIATGLGLSGGTITGVGTLLVDTASTSIISRQRAAALLGAKLDTSGTYINSIAVNSDALYNAASFAYSNYHVGTITQNLATQSAYKLFGTGSSSATPTFRNIDSNYFNNTFATQVRAAQTNTGGTVTSVELTTPTGLTTTGSPITNSGTLGITYTAGYSLPTTASQTLWDAAYTNRITSATYPIRISSNTINVDTGRAANAAATGGALATVKDSLAAIIATKQATLTATQPLTITSNVIAIRPAGATDSGYVTTGAQTFAGAKTMAGAATLQSTLSVTSAITATSNSHTLGNLQMLTSGTAGSTGRGIICGTTGSSTESMIFNSGITSTVPDCYAFNVYSGTGRALTVSTTRNYFSIYGGATNGVANSAICNILNVAPTYNNTGGISSNTVRGIYYNPTLTSLTGTTHIGLETVSGNVLLGTTSGSVGIGVNTTINSSAILDITSTTKGILTPRMTNAQMASISSPATGLELYNTDAKIKMTYDGAAYKSTGVLAGSYSGTATATTAFTVTFGGTQPNATYKVNVTPTSSLSAALFYVTNKTTTTFDVMYLAGLTGTVTFDYSVTQ